VAVAIRLRLEGTETLKKVLNSFSEPKRRQVLDQSLRKMAFRVQEIATKDIILRGGGPSAPTHPTRLRSRSGELRRSISGPRGKDTSELPRAIEVGTDLVYGPVHEFGATIKASGKPYLVFQLPAGNWVSVKKVTIPPRPFIGPAFDRASQEFEAILHRVWALQVGA
jgi:phage gpG-like protein